MSARILAEIFVFALGFVVSYTDFIALVPSRKMFFSGGNECNKVDVRDFRNSCANQNRVHFVVFPRLYVRRELEAATVWCETIFRQKSVNFPPCVLLIRPGT